MFAFGVNFRTHICSLQNSSSRLSYCLISSAGKMCYRTSDVGLKRIYCERKDESKGEKNSLHHTIKRKKRKITLAAPAAVSALVTFFCMLLKTPSVVHVPPLSPTFLTDMLTSLLCISQPNRMWHPLLLINRKRPLLLLPWHANVWDR